MAATSTAAAAPGVTQALIDAGNAALYSDARFRVALNAVTRTNPQEVLIDRATVTRISDVYSVQLDAENTAADQKSSGRCWIFAFLNTIRRDLIKKHNFKADFELSQSHLHFWDKIERSNFFLEKMIELVHEPLDGRLIHHLLSDPISDGGQWDMLANLVAKYGMMPKTVWPEAWTSGNTAKLNAFLQEKLRGGAAEFRALAAAHPSASFAEKAVLGDALRHAKDRLMVEIYRVVAIHLGEPVFKFDWQYEAKDKTGFTRIEGLTPQAFARDVCHFDASEYVSVIHDPRNETGKLYTVEHLGNMWGGLPVRYVNAPIDTLKALTKARLEAGSPVWFGCDVGKEFYRDGALLDPAIFQYELVLGTKPTMDKRTRLLYGMSLMTHAMDFVGCDCRGPRGYVRWRVENSWGKGTADGYLSMSDQWFDEYVYQVVVKRSELAPELLAVLDQHPVVLPAWDPMGNLARPFNPDQLDA